MRLAKDAITDVDQHIEEAHQAKHGLDFDRLRADLRPRVMQLFASNVAKLTLSRAALKAVAEELHPDAPFWKSIGNLDHVPLRHRLRVIAVALRHSWRHDQLARFARRLARPSGRARWLAIPRHTFPTITVAILWLDSAPSRLFASLRPRMAGLTALTGHSVEPCLGSYVMVGKS